MENDYIKEDNVPADLSGLFSSVFTLFNVIVILIMLNLLIAMINGKFTQFSMFFGSKPNYIYKYIYFVI